MIAFCISLPFANAIVRYEVVIFTSMHFVLSIAHQKLHAAVHFSFEVDKKEKYMICLFVMRL